MSIYVTHVVESSSGLPLFLVNPLPPRPQRPCLPPFFGVPSRAISSSVLTASDTVGRLGCSLRQLSILAFKLAGITRIQPRNFIVQFQHSISIPNKSLAGLGKLSHNIIMSRSLTFVSLWHNVIVEIGAIPRPRKEH